MVAVNEQEVPCAGHDDSTNESKQPILHKCMSTRRFSLLERFHGFVLIVIALLVSSLFLQRQRSVTRIITRDKSLLHRQWILLLGVKWIEDMKCSSV